MWSTQSNYRDPNQTRIYLGEVVFTLALLALEMQQIIMITVFWLKEHIFGTFYDEPKKYLAPDKG